MWLGFKLALPSAKPTMNRSWRGGLIFAWPMSKMASSILIEFTEMDVPSADARRYELRSGDVLMTEGGDFDKLGRGFVWSHDISGCLHQNHIFAVRPKNQMLSPFFLARLMTSNHGKAYFT